MTPVTIALYLLFHLNRAGPTKGQTNGSVVLSPEGVPELGPNYIVRRVEEALLDGFVLGQTKAISSPGQYILLPMEILLNSTLFEC